MDKTIILEKTSSQTSSPDENKSPENDSNDYSTLVSLFLQNGILTTEKIKYADRVRSKINFSKSLLGIMNYPAAELRGIKMNFYLINPDAEHRGILLIKIAKH
jgi:hypothetical protein